MPLFRILRVTGSSLTPQFQPGDFVLLTLLFLKKRLKPGAVIAFRQPGYGLLLKRIIKINPASETCWLEGDAPGSVDSRTFGEVPLRAVTGLVISHLHPRG